MAEQVDLTQVLLDAVHAQMHKEPGEAWTSGQTLIVTVAGHSGRMVGLMAQALERRMTDPAESSRMWLDVVRVVLEGIDRGRREGRTRAASANGRG